MKYLTDYIDEAQTAIFKKHGAFFAFSDNQFSEKKVDGVNYMDLGSGLICPVENVNDLRRELSEALKQGVKEDVEENGIENIIERELGNHEAWYTGELDDTFEALSCYGELISSEMVESVYRNNMHKHLED